MSKPKRAAPLSIAPDRRDYRGRLISLRDVGTFQPTPSELLELSQGAVKAVVLTTAQLHEERELRLKGPKAGGQKAAVQNKALDERIAAAYDELIRTEIPSRQRVAILAQRFSRQLAMEGKAPETQKRRIRRILARTSRK